MTYGEYTELEYDAREGDPDIIEALEIEYDYTMVSRTLPLFDYLQGDAGIERKSVADFIQSYKSDHIWDQCNRMVSQDEIKPYLIIVGTEEDIENYYDHRDQHFDLDSYYGALGSVMSRYGFSIATVPNSLRFANLAAKIFHSHRHGKAGKLRELKVTSASKYSAVAKILALVPGIDQQALAIAEQLNVIVPRDIWNITHEEFKTVDGIGDKKAEAIIDYLGI